SRVSTRGQGASRGAVSTTGAPMCVRRRVTRHTSPSRFSCRVNDVAGYSGTPLPKKLGIKPGARLGVASAPDTFEDALGELPEGVALVDALRTKQPCDVIVGFVRRQAELRRLLPRLMRVLDPNGGLWIGWP